MFFSFGDILWNGYGCPSTGNMEVTISDMVRDLQSEAYEYIHGKAGGGRGIHMTRHMIRGFPFP